MNKISRIHDIESMTMKIIFRQVYWIIALIVILICQSNCLNAQEKIIFNNHRHKIGFNTGFGGHSIHHVFDDYRVLFFQLQYYYPFHRKQSWSLEILVQPQYNLSRTRIYTESTAYEITGYEVGINVGFLVRKNFMDDLLGIYGLISTGPHYVSLVPEKQANGFIFSDNVFIGINVRLLTKLYLDLRTGCRHISNAGLQDPNEGIDNFIITGGFFLVL